MIRQVVKLLRKPLMPSQTTKLNLMPFLTMSSPRNIHTNSASASDFTSIRYWVSGHVANIQLHRPHVLNAIAMTMPGEIETAIHMANDDTDVKVILLSGKDAFCSGYDLKKFAESERGSVIGNQKMPWDPYEDYQMVDRASHSFMSIWRSYKPVVGKIQRVAIGGGSDMALCCDITVIEDDAKIGYPPSRVFGCPTTAMWFYRVGVEQAKRILLTGEILSGKKAAQIGLIGESVPADQLDAAVDKIIARLVHVPSNQLFFQKQVINNAVEMMGLGTTQRLATLFDGMSRHTPEGVAFQQRSQKFGFKKAVLERDSGEETEWSHMNKKSNL